MNVLCKISVITLLLVTPFFTYAKTFDAKVVSITDGDTVKVLTSDKELIKIRLAEIDTPEKKQPWGSKAKQKLSNLIFSQLVTVEPVTKDRYGRVVAHIYLNKTHVNREMVKTGNAWVHRKYMKDESLLDDENHAKTRRLEN